MWFLGLLVFWGYTSAVSLTDRRGRGVERRECGRAVTDPGQTGLRLPLNDM